MDAPPLEYEFRAIVVVVFAATLDIGTGIVVEAVVVDRPVFDILCCSASSYGLP